MGVSFNKLLLHGGDAGYGLQQQVRGPGVRGVTWCVSLIRMYRQLTGIVQTKPEGLLAAWSICSQAAPLAASKL